MNWIGTQPCQTVIQSFIAANNLPRLKELLPVIFDQDKIYSREGQMRALRDCRLNPVVENLPYPQVTFLLENPFLPLPPRRSPPSTLISLEDEDLPENPVSSPSRTTSASERSWPSSVESEPD